MEIRQGTKGKIIFFVSSHKRNQAIAANKSIRNLHQSQTTFFIRSSSTCSAHCNKFSNVPNKIEWGKVNLANTQSTKWKMKLYKL